jgi:DNA-binding transcriptional MocR family regulator
MDSVNEHGDKFRNMAERRIREALESGELQVEGGPDKQLDLEENPFAPEEWRLAFRVLKSGNYRPDWIELAGDIENDLAAWRTAADRHFAFLRRRLDALTADPGGLLRLREEVAALKLRHERATAYHARMMDEINQKIHRYNATVPASSLMRATLAADEEMRRFADRLPAYLNY